jgi:L-ribulokinase
VDYGVPIQEIVCCGGIAEKNSLLMQIYADVLGCKVAIAASAQACALGSAIVGAVVAGSANGGYENFMDAQVKMVAPAQQVYAPRPENTAVYNQLYSLYRQLHDSFGGLEKAADLGRVMKELIRIKTQQVHLPHQQIQQHQQHQQPS